MSAIMVAGLLCWAGLHVVRYLRMKYRSGTDLMVSADLHDLARLIEDYLEEHPNSMADVVGETGEITPAKLVAFVQSLVDRKVINRDDLLLGLMIQKMEMKGSLLDDWGQPYHGRVIGTTVEPGQGGTSVRATRFVLWSDGPNKRFENGKGDDVKVEFSWDLKRINQAEIK